MALRDGFAELPRGRSGVSCTRRTVSCGVSCDLVIHPNANCTARGNPTLASVRNRSIDPSQCPAHALHPALMYRFACLFSVQLASDLLLTPDPEAEGRTRFGRPPSVARRPPSGRTTRFASLRNPRLDPGFPKDPSAILPPRAPHKAFWAASRAKPQSQCPGNSASPRPLSIAHPMGAPCRHAGHDRRARHLQLTPPDPWWCPAFMRVSMTAGRAGEGKRRQSVSPNPLTPRLTPFCISVQDLNRLLPLHVSVTHTHVRTHAPHPRTHTRTRTHTHARAHTRTLRAAACGGLERPEGPSSGA